MVFSYIPDRLRLVPFTVELSDGRTVQGLLGYYFPKHGKYVNRTIYQGFNLLKKGRALNIPSWVVCKQLYTMWIVEGRIPSNDEVADELANLLDCIYEHPEYYKTAVYNIEVEDCGTEGHPTLVRFGIKNIDSYPEDPSIIRKMRKALPCPLPLDFGVSPPVPLAPCPLPSSSATEPTDGSSEDEGPRKSQGEHPKDQLHLTPAPSPRCSYGACDGGVF